MTQNNKLSDQDLQQMSNAIRFLAIDAIEKSQSGHPGMPMGMADVATILFTEFLKFDPKKPDWADRDRFILSAGHGSMLLYALFYLTGYEDIDVNDIKHFRQLGSKTAGHPEFGELAGIETTTGPLGQGLANAVGMALAEKISAAKFGDKITDHKTYCIAGDGCLMEGISQEAISLAGHFQLSKLVVLWDDNSISIDGDTNITTSENMPMRFKACGWDVIEIDGHNYSEIRKALTKAEKSTKPVMIACKTIIAFGSPNKAGSEKSHGSPLGEAETKEVRKKLNWPHEPFIIPDDILENWRKSGQNNQETHAKWQLQFEKSDSKLQKEFLRLDQRELPDYHAALDKLRQQFFLDKPAQATRKSSGDVLELLTKEIPELIGGSADLTGSVNTKTSSTKPISKDNFSGRYIHYGVREHGMGALMNGMALHKGIIPYAGTFLVFADYMKPAIRLSALMKQQVIYILTHDSIGLGEDGPTHQPVEQLANLRSIPNLNVFRPGDALEVIGCFEQALTHKNTPSAIVLTRQKVHCFQTEYSAKDPVSRGGYVISDTAFDIEPDAVIIATGSEVEIAIAAKNILNEKGLAVKVVSMPCFEIFAQQSQSYKNQILGPKTAIKVGIEAAVYQGWHRYLGEDGIFVGMESFGASGKAEDLFKHFKITPENVAELVLAKSKSKKNLSQQEVVK